MGQKRMNELRKLRGLPPLTKDNLMMERTRAAVGYINATNGGEKMRMAAFLDIFHPEITGEKRQAILIGTPR